MRPAALLDALAFAFVLATWTACDSAAKGTPDVAPDVAIGCPPCPLGAVCVERFNGTCGTSGPSCVATTETCPPNTCSAACEQALCGSPYQCQTRPPCGSEATGAFTCYGP